MTSQSRSQAKTTKTLESILIIAVSLSLLNGYHSNEVVCIVIVQCAHKDTFPGRLNGIKQISRSDLDTMTFLDEFTPTDVTCRCQVYSD